MKKILALTLAIVMLLSLSTMLVSCDQGKQEDSVEDKVRQAVEIRGLLEHNGSTIGGKELKSSSFSVSTISKKSDTHYVAYGSATMTDVYGTVWKNTFSCDVKYSETKGTWSASNVKYTSTSWNN